MSPIEEFPGSGRVGKMQETYSARTIRPRKRGVQLEKYRTVPSSHAEYHNTDNITQLLSSRAETVPAAFPSLYRMSTHHLTICLFVIVNTVSHSVSSLPAMTQQCDLRWDGLRPSLQSTPVRGQNGLALALSLVNTPLSILCG